LSILKEDPNAHPADVKKAAQKVTFCQDNLGDPSEMALLSRLHWWTVEYGLIGTLENPKIYGAGLLSSIGESVSCMQPEVKKIPYNLDTVNYSYDITQPQPQLFVTPDFQNLITVLEAFADTMSFRKGGAESILKAIESKNPCTAVYSSGLQVTGVFTDVGLSKTDELLFIKTSGPSALSFQNIELEGHAKTDHPEGFSSPVGKLTTSEKALEDFEEEDLAAHQLLVGENTNLQFNSGLRVSGKVKNILKRGSKILLISLEDATVKDEKENILFQPAWGDYDMAVGEIISSVFCGAADKDAYQEISRVSAVQTHQITYEEAEKTLHQIYQKVRTIRTQNEGMEELPAIFKTLKSKFRSDWLCALEILEILEQHHFKPELIKEINDYLSLKTSNEPELKKLILDGIGLIKNPVTQLIIQE
jgi:phenylalanine-4-hydroxylase